MRADVIVVGAGPVGLMLAGELRLGGAKVAVYDRLPAPSGESRALGFTKRVAELFDQRGLLTRLGDIRWGQQGHFGGVHIDLGMLADNHRGVLGLPQSRTEEMLGSWLGELGVPVRRGYEIVGLRETADEVVAEFAGPQGRHEESARYLAGCDGGQSTTRGLAGIEAHGWDATRGAYMADITGVELPQRPVGVRIPGGNMVLSVRLPDGYYRLVIQDRSLPARPDPATLTFAEVADTWQRLTGESIHHAQARWVWACGNAAALAAQYRRGRVFLAGDAAHDLPPLAGWGLSTGIQDAVNLGWKLAAELRGAAPPGLLDSYHSERHPFGAQLLRNTHAASVLYLNGDEMEPVRDVMRELMMYPSAAAHLAGMVSGLSVRYEMGGGEHPMLGLRLPPDRELDLPDGHRARVAELLRPGRGLFICAGCSPEELAGWPAGVDVITGSWVPANGTGPHQPLGSVLVRPDGYIAWAGPDAAGDLAAAVRRWFAPGARRVSTGSRPG